MEGKGLDFPKKIPPEPETTVNRSVPRCFRLRETGFKLKTNTVPPELQWAAEDGMVRDHTEYSCQLPDVSRSTFLVVFSPDGKKVASTHGNHNVYVTDLASGKNIKTLSGHPRTPWCIAFHPSSNQILASGCLGGQVRVWDLSGGSEIWTAESQTVIASLAFHPVDRMLVIASYNELHFWDWSQPEPFAKCFTANEKERVRYVAFDTLGHKLMTGVANFASRPASQWDRVAAPQPPPPNNQLDSERRITICYRYMVEQYEQLVQRYYDLSRARSTLTMDRGTDPMEMEAESSDSPNTTQSGLMAIRTRGRRLIICRPGSRPRPSSGTDEASASHSSTNFLTPPEPDDSPPITQPLLASSSDISTDSNASETPSMVDAPRRNPRFNITLPSFSNFRSRSPSASTPNSFPADTPSTLNTQNSRSAESTRNRPLSRLSLSPDAIGFNRSAPLINQSGDTVCTQDGEGQLPNTSDPPPSVHQLVRNLVNNWYNIRHPPSDGTSTEVPSGVDSENEESESFHSLPPEPLTEDESQSESGIDNTPQRTASPSARGPRNAESPSRQYSEVSAVSQLRSQFHRLQSVYENRNNAYSSHAHVFSPETQAAERRLLNRLNEFLDRPLPEPRSRRLFASRRSAFQPRPQPPPTAPSIPSTSSGSATAASPDIIGGVRYGIQLLSRHIDNMQRLCRARLEILQLQQIRRMWEDLQSQIYALHGVVREGRTEEGGETATQTPPQAENPPADTSSTAASSDLLTDDDSDGPSSNGELHWRLRRTPQTSRRGAVKTSVPRTTRNLPYKRTRLMMLRNDLSRRVMNSMMQNEQSRRQHSRQAPTPTQGTTEERAEASSSQETSGTSDEQRTTLRGIKRKSRDPEPLFLPRPSQASAANTSTLPTSSTGAPSGNGTTNSTSSLAAVMRETIVQLENMVWRHRQSSSQRNSRVSRFTRQREERMMRHLWDTESSHESSRDDQSEGDSSQQSTPGGLDTEWTRDSTRLRARQVLLLMVDSLTQFFENDNFSRRTSNEALNDRIHSLYVLLQLALNLTDLLLAQLVNSRRELEARRPSMLESYARHAVRAARHNRLVRNMSRIPSGWRRVFRRGPAFSNSSPLPPPYSQCRRPPSAPAFTNPTNPTVTNPSSPNITNPSISSPSFPTGPTPPRPPWAHRYSSVYSHIRPGLLPHPRHVVPIVRVNDLPPPPPESMTTPRYRPHSPPPMSSAHPPYTPPRFLHPARYVTNPLVLDESTSEDSSSYDRSSDFIFMRGYGNTSVFLSDTSSTPHHRIQAWDFSKYKIPDLCQAEKNIVVSECKIHNDASVDISKDGRMLVTLLPSGRLSMTTLLGIYSLQWSTLGQLLYTTSFEQSIVSVSLSPTSRHLVVGLASRRVTMVTSERHTNAQVFRLEGASPGRKALPGARGRLVHIRDLELSRYLNFMSLNCIRWAPIPGQGLVYGTNTGHLKVLR